jgi:hypothetical protein
VIGDLPQRLQGNIKHASNMHPSIEDLVVATVRLRNTNSPVVRPAEQASPFRVLSLHLGDITVAESAVHRRKEGKLQELLAASSSCGFLACAIVRTWHRTE